MQRTPVKAGAFFMQKKKSMRTVPADRAILFCNKNIATKGQPRRFPKGDGSPVASPPKAEVESGATMIGKPFGE